MDLRNEPPGSGSRPSDETITCGMCQRRVPELQTRSISGRPLCLGCLTAWYGEDEDEDDDGT